MPGGYFLLGEELIAEYGSEKARRLAVVEMCSALLEHAIESDAPRSVSSVAVTIFDQYGTKLVNADSVSLGKSVELDRGRNQLTFRIDRLHLNPGVYIVGLWMAKTSGNVLDQIYSAIRIDVVDLEENEFGMRIDGAVTCDFQLVEN